MSIKTTTLGFSYPHGDAFHFDSLALQAGERLLVTGPSGSGKSTFLHILSGFLPPNTGEVEITGTNIYSLNERKRDGFRGKHIGIVFQQHHFVRALSALDNVILSWQAVGAKPDYERAKELMNRMGLGQKLASKTYDLSQGEQQRLSIIRAIVQRPALLLADEPTSALDDTNANEVAKQLIELAADFNSALVVVTHDQRLKDVFPNTLNLLNAKTQRS